MMALAYISLKQLLDLQIFKFMKAERPRVPEKATETKGLPPPCVPVDAFVERVSRGVALGRMARASLTPALGFGARKNMICASRAGG